MIPSFPIFKKIDINDRDSVNSFLPRKPYSDYNFTNLWCWDTDQKRLVSQLNGNLVVIFTDYITKKLCMSFYGTRKPVSTARTLIQYAQTHGIEPHLKYIPEHTAQKIKKNKGVVLLPDMENFDYIFSTTHIGEAKGARFKKKRQLANKFMSTYPDAQFKIEHTLHTSLQKDILSTMNRWHRKKKNVSKEQFEHEKNALMRLLKTGKKHRVVVSAVYLHTKMLAFSIDEILPHKYAISHFLKADNEYTGVYEYLNQMTAVYLKEKGIAYWNWEQDLNIEGLRKLKMSYRPVHFLKKYIITLPH